MAATQFDDEWENVANLAHLKFALFYANALCPLPTLNEGIDELALARLRAAILID